jgi:hypothetical protein
VSHIFVVVKISLQTGGFTLLNHYLRSQLFVWVGVLMVYTILDATVVVKIVVTWCLDVRVLALTTCTDHSYCKVLPYC